MVKLVHLILADKVLMDLTIAYALYLDLGWEVHICKSRLLSGDIVDVCYILFRDD